MTLEPVKSSNLTAVGYDPATKRMRVQFSHGGVYEFQDVSPTKHRRFLSAKSKGGYFAAHFRDNETHKGRRLAANEI